MTFAIRRLTPPLPSNPFFTLFYFAIKSYIYETDFTLVPSQKYHFQVLF